MTFLGFQIVTGLFLFGLVGSVAFIFISVVLVIYISRKRTQPTN
jgi:hypothetical protein